MPEQCQAVISARKSFKATKLAAEEGGMGLISHSTSDLEHSAVLDITGGLGHPVESYVQR